MFSSHMYCTEYTFSNFPIVIMKRKMQDVCRIFKFRQELSSISRGILLTHYGLSMSNKAFKFSQSLVDLLDILYNYLYTKNNFT